jgi:hypothetical protein
MACLCAAQLPDAAAAQPETVAGLCKMLDDDDRYNRAFATVALRKLVPLDDSGKAAERLIHFLLTSRFDSDGVF